LRVDRSDPAILSPDLCGRLGSEAAPSIVRRARLVAALLAAAFVAFVPPPAAAQDAGDNADTEQKTGIPADDFDFLPVPEGSPSPWAMVDDATAAGGVALEQRGKPAYANHSLAVYKPVSVTDAEISLRIKATGGREDQGGGVALRLTAPDSYYLVEMDARRDRVVFLRVANGDAEEIISVDADIAPNAWHRLTVRAVDDEFVVSLDSVWAFTVFDKALSGKGRVALWTATDSVTRFDSLAIAPLLSPSAQHW
jgi:hypothetical protein